MKGDDKTFAKLISRGIGFSNHPGDVCPDYGYTPIGKCVNGHDPGTVCVEGGTPSGRCNFGWEP